MDIHGAHHRLVDALVARGLIRSSRVEAAFRAVQRHAFLPGMPLDVVYSDEAVPTRVARGQLLSSSSQPAIMAIMLEQLAAGPGIRILEIGAGTGYNAALLAHIAGDRGHVTTVDIDGVTAAAAARHLAASGYSGVEVVCADGRAGWPANAPYDRIIATAAVDAIPPAWVAQLPSDGLLVAPVGDAGVQQCTTFALEEGRLVVRSATPCGFMLLRDAVGGEN